MWVAWCTVGYEFGCKTGDLNKSARNRHGFGEEPAEMTLRSYKGYFIKATALLVHPFSPE
jgi:hypothetical protein